MRTAGQHILFLATEYDAPGMRPYCRSIINALWQEGDHVLAVSRYGTDNEAFPGIPADALTWIDYPTSKLSKAVFRFRPTSVLNAIDDITAHCGISLIYSLTEELILADSIDTLQRRVPVLYTVHDARFHDYKAANPLRWLKNRLLLARPQRLMLERTTLQVTNSRDQQEYILQRFPYHKVHYAPFPTLVNAAIAGGGKQVEELQGLDDGYILFFGTLHKYKGVHLLYETYLNHLELQDRALVIAGTQRIYFERRADEHNVTFINRFIDDCEVSDLFSRAAVVVYPYISATQSGVTSIAGYFGKPMVLSDLPFFKETCEGSEGVDFFPAGNSGELAAAIKRLLESPASTAALYQREYSPQAMTTALNQIIAVSCSRNP